MIIREFAPAKINIALHVCGRRTDGYHDLDSVVAFASVGDDLALSIGDSTALRVDGPFADTVPTTHENLVLKAYAALSSVVSLPSVAIRLTKNLPVASGIGGGSADAAAALRGLLKLVERPIDPETLLQIALSLGADVPVCLFGKSCRMQGVGDVITAMEQPPARAIVLVNPLKPCSTADVFRQMGLQAGQEFGTALDLHAPATWRNDMTESAIAVLPEIGTILTDLQAVSPDAIVRMSGSGATCFALYNSLNAAAAAGQRLLVSNPTWWIAPAELI